jgi:xylulokinase
MPEALPPGEIAGEVSSVAAQVCGLPVGLPVVAGVGDGQAGGLGVNITQSGQAYLNLGTAVVSGTHTDTYVIDPAFRTMYSPLPGAYSLETVLLGGTYTITWFVENWAETVDNPAKLGLSVDNSGSIEEMYESAIQNVPPGAEGLMLVPYWNSAMNPYWDATASGIVVGWRGVHRRRHLYRAILEGIGFEQRLHIEGVESALGRPVQRFVAMGGGARSALWCQIIADITGKPVYRATTPEASALGAGIQAAWGVGLFDDVRDAARAMTHIAIAPFKPDEERHTFYTRLYDDVYRHLFPALQPYVQRLTKETEAERFTNNKKME